MKQSLQLRLGQHLKMTPQLQQAIRLLQLSSLDLQTEIQQTIETNPMLEIEEAAPADKSDNGEGQQPSGENPDLDYSQFMKDSPAEPEWGISWKKGPQPASGGSDIPTDIADTAQSLADHLEWQVNVGNFSEQDRIIAYSLINNMDMDGYLPADIIDTLHQDLLEGAADEEITPDEITAVLNRVQHLDPPGIGARNLQECLLLQLQQPLSYELPFIELATIIVRDHFDELSHKDHGKLSRALDVDLDTVQQAIDTIRQLNPRPGGSISREPTEYIAPDVVVQKINGRWQAFVNNDISPQLKINDYYASLIRRADDSRDNQFLRDNLQEARWFIKSLLNRNETLLKVAATIVDRQQAFLEHGEEHMKPLVLRDIAEAVDMHESTISRVTTHKYMHTPRGIFEFKYFFSSHVSTASGGECSSTAIRAMIKKLIDAEDSIKPLSDNKLAKVLEEKGIKVARRTVAKYREGLLIPPSNERRLRA